MTAHQWTCESCGRGPRAPHPLGSKPRCSFCNEPLGYLPLPTVTASGRVTPEELAEIARLDALATPGPWVHSPEGVDEPHVSTKVAEGRSTDWLATPRSAPAKRWHDAVFMARAREGWPRLAREVAALGEEQLVLEQAQKRDADERLYAAKEADRARADLEALRAKAVALCDDAEEVIARVRPELVVALRAELDKPSGASLIAERETALRGMQLAVDGAIRERDEIYRELGETREKRTKAVEEHDKALAIADAWKVLAKARHRRINAEAKLETNGDKPHLVAEFTASLRETDAAIDALRALGVDPEQA